MKYLLLVCWDADRMNGQTDPRVDAPSDESTDGFPWVDDRRVPGTWLVGDQLAPPHRARSVRLREGETVVTDGPFTETKEAVGGFDLIECDNLDDAVEIAATHPLAEMGTIEVRPLWGN